MRVEGGCNRPGERPATRGEAERAILDDGEAIDVARAKEPRLTTPGRLSSGIIAWCFFIQGTCA
jgi:hypothetical protein